MRDIQHGGGPLLRLSFEIAQHEGLLNLDGECVQFFLQGLQRFGVGLLLGRDPDGAGRTGLPALSPSLSPANLQGGIGGYPAQPRAQRPLRVQAGKYRE